MHLASLIFFLGETAVSESSDEDLSHKAGWVWKGDRVTGDWVQRPGSG